MKIIRISTLATAALLLAACGQNNETAADITPAANNEAEAMTTTDVTEIMPGLTMKMLQAGSGDVAQSGQIAAVHYTGWLHDPEAADGRGAKFDSSLDRGDTFEFPLGAGRVIRGWDQGVVGMKVGEKRELVIAPDLAYGQRAVGDLIPPGSTLVFEVELTGVSGGAPAGQ
jgi:FKBP-type peptidyl-prolyl cis-trans isomerase